MSFKFDWEGNKEKVEELKRFMEECKDKSGALMPVLHEAQNLFGYLPIEVQKMISKDLNIPLAKIYGVATFYSRFSLIPKGKYTISVCLGTACYVKGSQKILDTIKEQLGIEVGSTTEDRKFSLEATRCLGACGLAPVMTVNEDVYGKMEPSKVSGILAKYQ